MIIKSPSHQSSIATIAAKTKSFKMTGDNLADNPDTTSIASIDLLAGADEAPTIHEGSDLDSQENAVDPACQPPPQPQQDEPEPISSTAQEKAVADYLRKRTAGSPFFEANPAPSLPVYDTDGTFQCFVFLWFAYIP